MTESRAEICYVTEVAYTHQMDDVLEGLTFNTPALSSKNDYPKVFKGCQDVTEVPSTCQYNLDIQAPDKPFCSRDYKHGVFRTKSESQ